MSVIRRLTVGFVFAGLFLARSTFADDAAKSPATDSPATALTLPGTPAATGPMSREDIEKLVSERVAAEMQIKNSTTTAPATTPGQAGMGLLQINGYFRTRMDLFKNGSLGNGLYGISAINFPDPISPNRNTVADTNMRLRLEPTLHVSEKILVKMQLDLLDNLIWGSTPDGLPVSDYVPLIAFSQSQVPPQAGFNSTRSSIEVKRAWAEVLTRYGQLRFGRMPSHWGLGVLANDGNCLECNYGSTMDRLMFVTKLANLYVAPGVDLISNGPTNQLSGSNFGSPLDADQTDDVVQYVLAIARKDKDLDIKDRLDNGLSVLNWGLYSVFRMQPYDYSFTSFNNLGTYNVSSPGSLTDLRNNRINRGARLFIPDAWFKYVGRHFRVEAELVGIFGSVKNDNLDPVSVVEPPARSLTITQFGGVLQLEHRSSSDALKVGVEVGFASGDDASGFGIKPFSPPQKGAVDRTINNFRFNQDYVVDMIFWRQIMGTVTDAWYAKPNLLYTFSETAAHTAGFGLDAIYSQAMFASSAPGNKTTLGLEVDAKLIYRSQAGFFASAAGGLFFPFDGMTNLGADGKAGTPDDLKAKTASSVQGRLGVTF